MSWCSDSLRRDGLYTQCNLVKGNLSQVAWIPKPFAKLGKVLQLKVDGAWDQGWTVTDVYTTASEEFVDLVNFSLRHHKDVSDI